MDEKIAKLLEKVEDNPELEKALSECKDPVQAYALLEGEGSGVTVEEFKTAMKSFAPNTELSENDLEQVAGGGLTEKEKTIVGGTTIGIGVVTTAASAAV